INTTLSLQQSEVANRQATEATRQGKTVMTFTFATVLFVSLMETKLAAADNVSRAISSLCRFYHHCSL
ncbi:hypothetical protein FOC1_g10008932, partial [Fusarium oxysporum f. sp. cubense race 1]